MSFLRNLGLGLLFGIGLVVSGMSDPAKVLNFLDLFGTWDPSLAFVIGGAVVVAFFGYRVVFARTGPIAGDRFHMPAKEAIDGRLVAGAALFVSGRRRGRRVQSSRKRVWRRCSCGTRGRRRRSCRR
jgi:uncharacterized membrane protein YedE/YeeE